jgi:hypothetical protein
MNANEAIAEIKSLGFKTWDRGGGCTALGLTLSENRELIVTDGEDGGGEPTETSTAFMVGLFDPESGDEIECETREFEDAIARVRELIFKLNRQ